VNEVLASSTRLQCNDEMAIKLCVTRWRPKTSSTAMKIVGTSVSACVEIAGQNRR